MEIKKRKRITFEGKNYVKVFTSKFVVKESK